MDITSNRLDPWVERLKADSEARDSALIELRQFLVVGLTRALSQRYGGKIQVEDVAQLALLQILKSLDRFEGRSRFTTWAMSIAVRIGISELRKHHYRDISLDQSNDSVDLKMDVTDSKNVSPERQSSQQSILTLLQELIERSLSDRQKIAIRGTLQGLPVEEIAHRLHSNRNAVYKLVHDARLKLRHGLEASGVTEEDLAITFGT